MNWSRRWQKLLQTFLREKRLRYLLNILIETSFCDSFLIKMFDVIEAHAAQNKLLVDYSKHVFILIYEHLLYIFINTAFNSNKAIHICIRLNFLIQVHSNIARLPIVSFNLYFILTTALWIYSCHRRKKWGIKHLLEYIEVCDLWQKFSAIEQYPSNSKYSKNEQSFKILINFLYRTFGKGRIS